MQARPLLSPYLFEQHTDMDSYYEKHGRELLRDMHAWLFQLLQKGITTFAYVSKADMYEQALHRLHRHPYEYRKLSHHIRKAGSFRQQDIRLLAEMGFKVFRMSIAWSRIFPMGDEECSES